MKNFLPTTLKKNSSGFTLIELMITISIIAILAVTGIIIYTGAQKRARDSKRRQDITSITQALETNKPPTSPIYAPLANSHFSGGKIPSEANPEKYCLAKNTIDKTPPAEPVTAGDWQAGQDCPGGAANYKIASSSASAVYENGSDALSWTVCAYLEQDSPNYFCRSSSQ
ncbi:MAG: hypothetical protein ACD_30C00112G0035 [uncultured bacterium]|uniref:Fimbrial protein pilin n=4 Tax=Candidatus Daviesiibacteriota TaxID=1752718 RepID=A0A0G0FAG8_9BACT|nr:MAG: hypothetical protein ACD_30C00112G0035 [uncultured bacterium]KKQ10545.1 MAG: Fimbrial protein pilin [Candidatus Daviesbacteria bacterium GW2011_GWB1_36_5]KKQ15288.1 MAG: Fimbrial protein pilin [Candidatus Daviesbacteria bacterium GW2011_GWA1_36_8]OGE17194.1 MAG: hypothetical protein A2858_00625 [Candidatus Daviesbacteria bacterium RIFCSPHIGHO2_01_FULL_36_37]OGE35975.1 MAG: hypothetical protein A3E66_01620 [Candidatus Daviesbacteria bacterium RIFCSPHIGHO2_12_FULL_37_16]